MNTIMTGHRRRSAARLGKTQVNHFTLPSQAGAGNVWGMKPLEVDQSGLGSEGVRTAPRVEAGMKAPLQRSFVTHIVEARRRFGRCLARRWCRGHLCPRRTWEQCDGRLARRNPLQKVPVFAKARINHAALIHGPTPIVRTIPIPLASPENPVFPDDLPKYLLVMGEQFGVLERKFAKAICRIHIPKALCLCHHGHHPVRPLFQRYPPESVFDGPLNEARQRTPLLSSSQLRQVPKLRVKPDGRDLGFRELGAAARLLGFVGHSAIVGGVGASNTNKSPAHLVFDWHTM